MAQSPDHPQLTFVQAKGYTKGRPHGAPLWIVVHDMEAGENSARAETTAAYFANPSDGRRVSSHYTVDDNSTIQCVKLADSAWTVGNREGNNRGINWELSGFARQTRAEWLDEFGLAMFAQMRPIVQADAAKYGIPLVRRTRAELRAMTPGVTSHVDLAAVFGGSDHTDPGPAFPWDVFMQIMVGTLPAVEGSDQMLMLGYDSAGKVWVGNGAAGSRRQVGTRNAAGEFDDAADGFCYWWMRVGKAMVPARGDQPGEQGPYGAACPLLADAKALDGLLGTLPAAPSTGGPLKVALTGTATPAV